MEPTICFDLKKKTEKGKKKFKTLISHQTIYCVFLEKFLTEKKWKIHDTIYRRNFSSKSFDKFTSCSSCSSSG